MATVELINSYNETGLAMLIAIFVPMGLMGFWAALVLFCALVDYASGTARPRPRRDGYRNEYQARIAAYRARRPR